MIFDVDDVSSFVLTYDQIHSNFFHGILISLMVDLGFNRLKASLY